MTATCPRRTVSVAPCWTWANAGETPPGAATTRNRATMASPAQRPIMRGPSSEARQHRTPSGVPILCRDRTSRQSTTRYGAATPLDALARSASAAGAAVAGAYLKLTSWWRGRILNRQTRRRAPNRQRRRAKPMADDVPTPATSTTQELEARIRALEAELSVARQEIGRQERP